jgi:hypothetical protein
VTGRGDPVPARLTGTNVLVTLIFTMLGLAKLNLKISLLLLVPALAVVLGWSYLPRFAFILLLACGAIGALSVVLGRDAWRQARRETAPLPTAKAAPRPRARRAAARAARRGEVLLHPDATVTLSDERATAGVDDVFTSLDHELVGLVPVKKKVEEIASLLLVDRVRQKFGMSSRIAHHLDFAPYRLDELVAIGRAMLDQASYYLSDEAEAAFREYLTIRMDQPRFANARSVRNELERARLRHAHRLAAEPHLDRSRDDLMRLESADILTSPIFSLLGIDE